MEGQYNQDPQQQIRRKYPTDKNGLKSEWYGMEHHLVEIGQELQRTEKEILGLRKKQLLTELDMKILEQLQKKSEELEMKQFEAQEMLRRKQIYDEEQRRYLEDRKHLQFAISGVYDRQKQENMIKDLEQVSQLKVINQREQKLEWERMVLEDNRTRMDSELQKKRIQKDIWAQEQQQDLILGIYICTQLKAGQRHQVQAQNKQVDQQEQIELQRRNSAKEQIKEQNYKNFYRMCSDNQANIQRIHMDKVIGPLQERQRQLEELIEKNVDQYQRKLLQEELDRVLKRQQESQINHIQNKQMMAQHQTFKDYEKVGQEEKNKIRLDDTMKYNSYLDSKKQEKLDQRREYKEFLDSQQREKEEIKYKNLRMGKPEKAMNMLDLQSYKNTDRQIHSLIPGYSPQVGQLPPKQNSLIQKKSLVQLKQNESDLINQNLSLINNQDFRNYRTTEGDLMNQNLSTINTQDPRIQRMTTFREAGQNTLSIHNPLTNPMPFNNQNPYIRRELEQALSIRGGGKPY